jgi:hypothetical protein
VPEIFCILLAGGVMLAAAISDPQQVILRWLRLAGIVALAMLGVAAVFMIRRAAIAKPQAAGILLCFVAILGQLAFVQIAFRKTQRALATIAFVIAAITGIAMLSEIRSPRAIPASMLPLAIACIFASATMGLSLMDMLLGHAYLNAAKMTMTPFARLNASLAVVMICRAIFSVAGTILVQAIHPMEMFWNLYGLYIGTRWLVGFIVPGIFVFMAHDCIKRRATQSATGILYVAGVLIFIGEIIGLYLMSETGMPL